MGQVADERRVVFVDDPVKTQQRLSGKSAAAGRMFAALTAGVFLLAFVCTAEAETFGYRRPVTIQQAQVMGSANLLRAEPELIGIPVARQHNFLSLSRSIPPNPR